MTLNPLMRALFAGPANALTSLVLLGLLAAWLPGWIDWALVRAVFQPDAEACRAVGPAGACWGVVAEKGRIILFGRYPYDAQWRPAVASLLLLALTAAIAHPRAWRIGLLPLWGAGAGLVWLLLAGGAAGLAPVPTELWGGLPLTLLLTLAGIGLAFPLGLAIALGRRSSLPLLRGLLGAYVEVIRGLPLIPVLFLASFLFPLFLPAGWNLDVLTRVLAAIVLFAAAYLAETLRGGLESVPRTQVEAALALGLGERQSLWLVVLPQALRNATPALVNSAIALFKETSLVTVVGLFDLTGALSLALAGDPQWRAFHVEGYLFIGAIYALGCLALSRYGLWIEGRLRGAA